MKQLFVLTLFVASICLSSCVNTDVVIGENTPEESNSVIKLGKELWRLSQGEAVNPEEPSEYNSSEGDVYDSFLIEENQAVWKYNSRGPVYSRIVVDGDRLYFTNQKGNLFCLNKETGESLYVFKSGAEYASSPCIYEDRLLFQNGDGILIEVWKESGVEIRRIDLGKNVIKDKWDYFISPPLVFQGCIYIGAGRDSFFSLDLKSFSIQWQLSGLNKMHSEAQINGDSIYLSDMGGNIVSVNRFTGEVLWNVKSGGSIMGNISIYNDILFIGARDCKIHALDKNSGEELWFRSYGTGWIMSTPVVYEDSLIVTGSDGFIIQSINTQTGEELWTKYFHYNIAGSPLLFKDKIFIVVGDAYNTQGEGGLLILNPKDGTPLFRFHTTSSFSSAAVDEQIAYVGNEKGEVFAVDISGVF